MCVCVCVCQFPAGPLAAAERWAAEGCARAASVAVGADETLCFSSSRAWVSERGGTPVPLDVDAIELRRLRTWRSPRSGARWPTAWQIKGAGLDLVVESAVEDQELTVFPAPFYAGPARAYGTVDDQPVDVVAFVEHVGGFQPALRPLYRSDAPPEAPRAVVEREEEEEVRR